MGAAFVSQHPKSLGRSCEQSLSGISAVLSTLGDGPRQHFPHRSGKGDALHLYLCAPLCWGCTACLGFVYVLFILFDADTAGQGRVFAYIPFFEDTGRTDSPQTPSPGHWNAIGFLPFPVHAIGLTHLLELSPEGWLNGEKKSTHSMYLVYFSITIFTS